ncbi:hypothetical protein AVEN_239708-1 [Araneus ventricosus]|uniref:Uncharacterized protein n=1 Tax=Araneus ventricosus TaxID=182803 RepID=A0A4Y2TX49_ARAVE|nr:hypothetical protein AVEN_4769-1 [Araneus ventricosus]GBO05277.1 hypothetical protein AVEN_239708-1 [Araneus ventricosus]
MGQLVLWKKSWPRPLLLGEYRDEGTATCGFRSPNAPVLLIDKAIEVKICIVHIYLYIENHMFPPSISPSSTSCSIACINGIHTLGLASLDLVGEHVKVVAHDTVRGHSSESTTRCDTANGCPGLL